MPLVKPITRKDVLQLSEGVLSTLTDLTLFYLLFSAESVGRSPTSRGVWQAFDAAQKDLEQINYQTIKKTLYQLKSRGLVNYTRETISEPQITAQGLKRLKSTLPEYDEKRVWDGRIYLVTYDIPEDRKSGRELLRRYLAKIGAGRLQHSVWITPYNPKEVLKNFIRQNDLAGAVIISAVGDKDSVGDESIKELVARIYKLDELNDRYHHFVKKYSHPRKFGQSQKVELTFEFLSILLDDPQLPFKLLPADWQGRQAYQIYQSAGPSFTLTE